MGYFSELSSELGRGTGKGINHIISIFWKAFCIVVALGAKTAWKFLAWLADWQKAEFGESVIKKNNLRITAAGFIVACIVTPGLFVLPTLNFSAASINPFDRSVKVIHNLDVGEVPRFPHPTWFREVPAENQFYTQDGRKYVLYQMRSDGQPPVVIAERWLCAIVPVGRNLFINNRAGLPMQYVYNMGNEVLYATTSNRLPWWEPEKWFLKHGPIARRQSWRQFNKNQHQVDSTWLIRVKGLSDPDPNMPSTTYGGVVCF